MKKVITAILSATMVLAMAFCLTGCGEDSGKKEEAASAFNMTSAAFNEIADLVNANQGVIDDETIGLFQNMSDLLTQYKDMLEGDETLDDAQYDEMIQWFSDVQTWAAETKTTIEEELANGSGDDAQAADQTDDQAASASIFPAELEGVESYVIDDISATAWELSGGVINGEEMDQTDLDAVLAACGGALQLIFVDDANVQLINGENAYDGSYEYMDDNFAVHAVFDGYEYYGVLTYNDDQPVLIIANVNVPGQALYLTPIEG